IQGLAKDGRYSPVALKRLGAAATQARVSARERLAARLPAAKLDRLARRLDRVAKSLQSDSVTSGGPEPRRHKRAPLWAVEARVARRAASLRAAIAAAGAVYAPEQLHIVRIALKKLRYSVELAAEARQKPAGPDLTVL